MHTEAAFQDIGVYWRIGQPNPPHASGRDATNQTTTLPLKSIKPTALQTRCALNHGRVLNKAHGGIELLTQGSQEAKLFLTYHAF